MARPRKKKDTKLVPVENVEELQRDYSLALASDPKYSLSVDPENKYGMSEAQKKFISYYVQFKNINTAAELAEIDQDEANRLFVSYYTQSEIRRINMALYSHQFEAKLLNIDQIGGYLTSLITGENIPIADQLRTPEKLRVIELLLRVNEIKANAFVDPNEFMQQDYELEIKQLSIKSIKSLLAQKAKSTDVSKLTEGLTMEEAAYIETLPAKDLLQMIENMNKGEKNE